MNNTKKKILAIILVLVVLLLGGASIYVATQLSTRQAVAPNAPTSKPAAADCSSLTTLTSCNAQVSPDCSWYSTCNKCALNGTPAETVCATTTWVGSDACATTGFVSHIACLPGPVITCPTDCPTACGSPESDITEGCVDTCGNPATKHCPAVAACDNCSVKYYCNTSSYTCETTELKYKDVAPYLACDSSTSEASTCSSDLADNTSIKSTDVCYSTAALCAAGCVEPKLPELSGLKKAYKDIATNTAGNYSLTTEMTTVSKGQVFIYTIELKNISSVKATGVTIKDNLADLGDLTYVDAVAGCSYVTTTKEVVCSTTIDPGVIKKFSFRVRAADGLTNGSVIKNIAKITYTDGTPFEVTKNLTASTIVGCNNTCTATSECSTGLVCDTTTSGKCRLSACLAESDCACPPAVTETIAPTATATVSPTVTATATVTGTATVTSTTTPTKVAGSATVAPTILPETGIFDLPGIAAFGGGLILAVVGILLAL